MEEVRRRLKTEEDATSLRCVGIDSFSGKGKSADPAERVPGSESTDQCQHISCAHINCVRVPVQTPDLFLAIEYAQKPVSVPCGAFCAPNMDSVSQLTKGALKGL